MKYSLQNRHSSGMKGCENSLKTIDFHAHILPEIDDGSPSLEQSLAMLRLEWQSGIDVVVMTPHFYAERDPLDVFLSRRADALARVNAVVSLWDRYPSIRMGAEVAYFPGISRANGLEKLYIAKTKLLLLELPFAQWDEEIADEVEYLSTARGCRVILAHIERYLRFQKIRAPFYRVLNLPVIFQCNAEWLLRGERKLLPLQRRDHSLIGDLFKEGHASLLGSDCHNLTRRPPNLAAAREVLSKQFGPEVLQQIDALGNRLLQLESD